jgi:hypothetical protein
MSNFRLKPKEGTETFHRIAHGRKNVGRVTQHEDGRWMGIFGSEPIVYAASRDMAFTECVAVHLGYASAAQMAAAVQRRAAADRVRTVRAVQGIAQYMGAATFDQRLAGMDLALGATPDGGIDVEQMSAGFRVITKALFPKRRHR